MVYHITHKSASYLYCQNCAECALALPVPSFQDVPANVWYAQAAQEAVSNGWMRARDGNFLPAGTVTANDVTAALQALGINVPSLTTLPSNGSTILTKRQFLEILTEAFQPQLQAILKTKSQAEYTRVWNVIPAFVSHHNTVRMSILAGWIAMPQSTFHGAAPLTRAEMAQLLMSVLATIQQ